MRPLRVRSHTSGLRPSPDARAGVDGPALCPAAMIFLMSASLTDMLLRLVPRLVVRVCFDADVGRWRKVVVGEGEREREGGSSTITRERSSMSDGADGRLLFRLEESLNTSEGSARGDAKCCRCFGGSGGTGGVKASMRGVDGYDATDVVDGDDVIVRYSKSVHGRCMAT